MGRLFRNFSFFLLMPYLVLYLSILIMDFSYIRSEKVAQILAAASLACVWYLYDGIKRGSFSE